MADLKFRQDKAGIYFAQDASKHYTVFRDGSFWSLAVKKLVTTAGIQHAVGQNAIVLQMHDTKRFCVAVANAYSALGDNYREHEHGHQSRYTTALHIAHAEEN